MRLNASDLGQFQRLEWKGENDVHDISCDVAIIGGGPGGSTVASFLRKYAPNLNVHVFERERFPRDHVGESQLPPISAVLQELGCWDKVEAANFPIKVGATYRWGKTPELWDFEFLPLEEFHDEPRPAKYEGQRLRTAFQVDRAVYDEILLRHAQELGANVHEECAVASVQHEADKVTGLTLKDGRRVSARYYVDATGHVGTLRRALGVRTEIPTVLQNIAIWDYWENAKWAVEIGVGGTRIQIMSLKHGWLWFIPLSPTRTSIGFVCPASHYKSLGVTPEELYEQAVAADPRIVALCEGGRRRGPVLTTKDWSFVAERTYGANWFLVGEALGFADPILSAGLTLTHTGARELAYTILELERGQHDPRWLKSSYDALQTKRVRQHIRFADFWYAANGQFADLQDHCQSIASEAGLSLTSREAWRWLAQGGFTNDCSGQVGLGGCDLSGVKQIAVRFADASTSWRLNDFNVFALQLNGAKEELTPTYVEGRIVGVPSLVRGSRRLALHGTFETIHELLAKRPLDIGTIHQTLWNALVANEGPELARVSLHHYLQALEVMLAEGWVVGKLDPRKPRITLTTPAESRYIHANRDALPDRPTAQ